MDPGVTTPVSFPACRSIRQIYPWQLEVVVGSGSSLGIHEDLPTYSNSVRSDSTPIFRI